MKTEQIVLIHSTCLWYPNYESVLCNGETIKLTKNQSCLLELLIAAKNQIIDPDSLYWQIWDDKKEMKSKSLRNLVSDLKKKVPCLEITNFYGRGYLLKVDDGFAYLKGTIEIFEQVSNGICITNPHREDNPIIYVNKSFTDTFQYTFDEVVGQNCRFLQLDDRDQEGIALIRDAIENEIAVTTVVRNYKKDGELVYNQVTVSPIFDLLTQKLKFFIGVQKDISQDKKLLKQMNKVYEAIIG